VPGGCTTLPWRIPLKARVDRVDQTTRIYTQQYAKICQNSRAYYFQGIKIVAFDRMRQGGV